MGNIYNAIRLHGCMEKNISLAKKSFYCGLFFWVPLFNLIFAPLAIYYGFKSLKRIKKDSEQYGGKGFAITGIILGILPLWLGLVFLILYLFPGIEVWALSL